MIKIELVQQSYSTMAETGRSDTSSSSSSSSYAPPPPVTPQEVLSFLESQGFALFLDLWPEGDLYFGKHHDKTFGMVYHTEKYHHSPLCVSCFMFHDIILFLHVSCVSTEIDRFFGWKGSDSLRPDLALLHDAAKRLVTSHFNASSFDHKKFLKDRYTDVIAIEKDLAEKLKLRWLS
jgi:hypothetical protein